MTRKKSKVRILYGPPKKASDSAGFEARFVLCRQIKIGLPRFLHKSEYKLKIIELLTVFNRLKLDTKTTTLFIDGRFAIYRLIFLM